MSNLNEKSARQFSSPEALKEYLKNHPKADPSKHSVKPKKEKLQTKPPVKEEKTREEKTPAPKNDDLDSDVREKLKKLSPAKKKEILQKSILNNETEGEKTKQKDVSKEKGFEALKGLSPAAQKKLLEKALKMASEEFRKVRLKHSLVTAAASFEKTALSGKEKAKLSLMYTMDSKPSSAEVVLTDLTATSSELRGIHYSKIEQAAEELAKEGRVKFDGVVLRSIPGSGQKIALDLLKKVQSKFKKYKHLSTDLDVQDDPDQATLNVWDDNDEPIHAGILGITMSYLEGVVEIQLTYPGVYSSIFMDYGVTADKVFKAAVDYAKKNGPELLEKS